MSARQTQVTVRNHQEGTKRHFLLRVPPFFFLPPLDLETNSDPRKPAFMVSKVVTESSLTLSKNG